MADVRNLLRQQRAARRIEHPHAAYSDAGKLLCTLCHEPVKSESLWEGHLRAPGHTARVKAALQAAAATNSTATAEAAPSNKRKHDSDEDMVDDEDTAEAVRKKRSKTNISTPARLSAGESDRDLKDVALTPPSLTRRTSTTPVQGVEIQIPSRPATPAHKTDGTSSSSTPLVQPVGPSPLIPRETSPTLARANAPAQQNGAATTSGAAGDVDESEWAAFEAEIAATEAPAPFSEDAVISAPAMTAEQHAAAAKTEEEEREKRRLAAEKDLEDEKEEATRALEEEF
ncbi:zinc finger protein 830-like protein, partial [Colletotrichum musicola]